MAEIKYLYIDDSGSKTAVQNLKGDGISEIITIRPPRFLSEFFSILARTHCDGLILDQQLYETEIKAEDRVEDLKKIGYNDDDDEYKKVVQDNISYNVDYRGSSLASEIRTQESERKVNGQNDLSIPIILFSADKNVPQIIKRRNMGEIDMFIYKGETRNDFSKNIPIYRNQLKALALGYSQLKEFDEIKKQSEGQDDCDVQYLKSVLNIDDLSFIDHRFTNELSMNAKNTVHSVAHFVLNELIINQGILIDEQILAVRLGIDKEKSKDGWSGVLKSLDDFRAKYTGVFHEGWQRWWMPLVLKWWKEEIGNNSYLQFLSATQRVNIISSKLNINLEVVKAKSRFSLGEDYWTVCNHSNDPLSIDDGLLLPGQKNLYPWQDARYYAIMSVLDESLDVADSEQDKVNYYKDKLNKS